MREQVDLGLVDTKFELENLTVYEPRHDKTNKVNVLPARTLIRLGGCL